MSFKPLANSPYAGLAQHQFADHRAKIIIGATLWWVVLAAISRFDMSRLQISWDAEVSFFIFCYFPLCILMGLTGTAKLSRRESVTTEIPTRKLIYSLFGLFAVLFVIQCFLFTPPALASDPNTARLEWGFKYVHVLTEIVIRATVLICLGDAIVRNKLKRSDFALLMVCLAYTMVVVSRSFLLEILIYWAGAGALIKLKKGVSLKFLWRTAFLAIALVGVFLIYGEWRQEAGFSIVDYAEMQVNSKALAWIFGYFFVNFDNLALLLREHFNNGATTNLFGSLLQTLQLAKFDAVDSYLYVGKFNLGTAFRPYVLDFGGWGAGAVFVAIWTVTIMVVDYCKYSAHKYVMTLILFYIAFCLPITSRIEQPPYLFAIFIILFLDFSGRCRIVFYPKPSRTG